MTATSERTRATASRDRWTSGALAWQLWATLAAVLGMVLAVTAWLRPDWAVGPFTGDQGWGWLLPTPANQLWTLAFVGFATMAAYRVQAKPRLARYRELILISLPAAVTVGLGLAAYLPCSTGYSWVSVIAWTLNLFAGQVEGGVFGEGTSCPGAYPLGFQVARMTGLATLVVGAVTTVAALSRQQLDRWRIRGAAAVDVVVGVDAKAVALVKALITEKQERPRYPDWYDLRPEEKKASRSRGDREVVVIHSNGEEPALGELRAVGARILVGDPAGRDVLNWALLRRKGGRIALHRLFASSASQQRNRDVVDAAASVLDGAGVSEQDWLSQESVPRLVAFFDDPREARDWQLTRLDTTGFFVDALSVDGLLARSIVAGLVSLEPARVLVLGDSPLSVALLDELALQRHFRAELDAHRKVESMTPLPGRGLLDVIITLGGVGAEAIREEWLASCAPCGRSLPVECSSLSWEQAAVQSCPDGVTSAIVITDPPSRTVTSRATRLTRMHPQAVVFAPNDTVAGVEPLPDLPSRSVVHYGPSYLQDGGVPEDSWTVLARQQHQWWGTADTDAGDARAARRGWGQPADPVTQRLPEFFRDDNLRQLRNVLRALRLRGYRWRAVTRDDTGALSDGSAVLTNAEALEIGELEHQRWYGLRVAGGWRRNLERPGPGLSAREKSEAALRAERARLHSDLLPWEELSAGRRTANADAVRTIVARLYQWGIVPVREGEGA